MSRSVKKICAGTCCKCKSQKRGKKVAHRKFRKSIEPLYKMREAMNPWNLGGDGKRIYTLDKSSELYKQLIRK